MRLQLVAFFFSIILFPVLSSNLWALDIQESYKSKYYAKMIMEIHRKVVETELNKALKPYKCLNSDLNYEITKPFKSKFFGNDQAGELTFSVSTQCFNSSITDFKFYFDPGGYDEDYGVFGYKITTKTGVIVKRNCTYGLSNVVKNCPFAEEDDLVWSDSVL